MPVKAILKQMRDVSFSPEEIEAMATAYEIATRKLHDRGQPQLVNEVLAKRIIELGKSKVLAPSEMAEQLLASVGLSREM
jgi:hypothetical protein